MEHLSCPWDAAKFLIFSENVPVLLFYSHFTAVISALVVGIYIFLKNRKDLTARLLILLFSAFSFWAVVDVVIWATNRTEVVLFWWSMQILTEPIVYAIGFYLLYSFIYRKLPGRKTNLIIALALLPLIILLPTPLNLEGIYIAYCDAVEGPLALYYTYLLEVLFIFALLVATFKGINVLKTEDEKKKIISFTTGIIVFLLVFTSGNIIGSITENWDIAQYGLFGMPVFIGFLAYLIVRFKAFNVKIIATQALVWALWIMIGSILFVVQSDASIIITGITEAIALIFGVMLIRTVKREVEQRERLQKLTEELSAANEKLKELDKLKSEFLNFASHQVKSPMAVIKGFADLIASGVYGDLPEEAKEKARTIKANADRTLALVGNLLDLGKIESGKMDFAFAQVDIAKVVRSMSDDYKVLGEKHGLTVSYEGPADTLMIKADEQKIRQVIQNVIDNSIKYTKTGFVKIGLKDEGAKVLVTVTDSGQGISAELQKKLFGRFVRDEKTKNEIQGTGLGLYIAKQIVAAHNGEIWAESPGEGKGSTFNVRLSKE